MPIKLATSLVPGLVPNKRIIFPIKATNLPYFLNHGGLHALMNVLPLIMSPLE